MSGNLFLYKSDHRDTKNKKSIGAFTKINKHVKYESYVMNSSQISI